MNGYLPVGRTRTPLYAFSYRNPLFEGFLVKGTEQFAMKGLDAEVGYHFCRIPCMDLYAGAGPYYYCGRSAATENAFRKVYKCLVGGRLRVCASFLNYVTLEGSTTYDSRFNWGGQVFLAVHLPFTFRCQLGKDNACGFEEKFYMSRECRLRSLMRTIVRFCGSFKNTSRFSCVASGKGF